MQKAIPLHDRVIVRRLEVEELTKGGLFLPDIAKDPNCECIVVEVGGDYFDNNGNFVTPRTKPGDKVLLGRFSGTEIVLNGIKHMVLRESEILCILKEEIHINLEQAEKDLPLCDSQGIPIGNDTISDDVPF